MLKFLKRKPPLMLVLVAMLVALLALLATLQYRWLGQVSQGERERMQASLRMGAARFTQDFNREMTRAFLNFQLDSVRLSDRTAAAYAERYDNWMTTAPYPRLVSELFLVEANKEGALSVSRFNRAEAKFDPVDWPAELSGSLRQRLEDEHRNNSARDARQIEISLAPINEEIPALVIPIIPAPPLPPPPPQSGKVFAEFNRPLFPGYAIVTLNLDYIKQEFIPALANRYFSSGDGNDYNLAVKSRSNPANVIYRSDASQSNEALLSNDATANIFDLRLDQFDILVLEKNTHPGETLPRSGAPFRGLRVARIQAPARGGEVVEEGKNGRSRSVTLRYHNSLSEESSDAGVMNDADGRWQLLIKHRAGSLEAAVTQARRRNLVISFGVLLLLAASVATILVSTQRAGRLARQQMEFVAGVSHELRTPLAVICSAGDNLADGVIETPRQVEQYGALIRNEGRRLTKMVEQVLEFAGAQAGRKSYEMRAVVVAELIERSLTACQPLIEEGGFQIEKEIQANLPAVMADASVLERALQNLLGNAMKYAGESRWIGLRARVATNEGRALQVHITVEDRGPGIDPRDLPHIFEPFYRGQEATAAQIHGSGLGLSLVKHIMEAHGGKISVESTPGHGSCFTLQLPAVVVVAQPLAEDVNPAEESIRSSATGHRLSNTG